MADQEAERDEGTQRVRGSDPLHMTESPRKSATKTRGRPFGAGNPGKALGTRHRVTRAVEELLEGEAESLTRKAIERALAGDAAALRLCIERIAPVRKGTLVTLDLPPLQAAKDAANGFAALIAAIAAGELTTEEATGVAALLEGWRRTHETTELEARLSALEGKAR